MKSPGPFLEPAKMIVNGYHSGYTHANRLSNRDENSLGAQPVSSKVRILYLEDEKDLVTLVQLVLSRQGYQIIGARSLAQAKEIIEQERIDLFFLDLNLPDGSGWEMLDYLSQHIQYANTPKIIMSAQAMDPQRSAEREHLNNFSAVIGKPFQVNALIDVTQQTLRNARSSH